MLRPLFDGRTLALGCHDGGSRASAAMQLGCRGPRSALGGKDGPGTGIGGRGLGTEIGPSLQVVERVDDAAADLSILRPGAVGAMLLERAAGKAEEASGLGRAQKAWW